jgi:hypothetical protein
MNSILEGPGVHLVQSLVIHICRHGFGDVETVATSLARLSEAFCTSSAFTASKFDVAYLTLLIAKPVLGCSHDALALNTSDNVGKGDTRKVRVGRETFPIASAERVTA